ncbi:unnamed protein product, partial [Ectocarpus sp. 8 AP-2014]
PGQTIPHARDAAGPALGVIAKDNVALIADMSKTVLIGGRRHIPGLDAFITLSFVSPINTFLYVRTFLGEGTVLPWRIAGTCFPETSGGGLNGLGLHATALAKVIHAVSNAAISITDIAGLTSRDSVAIGTATTSATLVGSIDSVRNLFATAARDALGGQEHLLRRPQWGRFRSILIIT